MNLSEWKSWVAEPATKEFFEFLERRREIIKEEWAVSVYTGPDKEETLQRNAAALGAVALLKELQDVTYEEIEESKSE